MGAVAPGVSVIVGQDLNRTRAARVPDGRTRPAKRSDTARMREDDSEAVVTVRENDPTVSAQMGSSLPVDTQRGRALKAAPYPVPRWRNW